MGTAARRQTHVQLERKRVERVVVSSKRGERTQGTDRAKGWGSEEGWLKGMETTPATGGRTQQRRGAGPG